MSKRDLPPVPSVGQPTSTRHSRVSGGGVEHDTHHTHYPSEKGKGKAGTPGR